MRMWLKVVREGRNMSQTSVADAVSVSQQHYNFIESGERRPSPEVAKKIAEVLGFDWTRFFEEEFEIS